MTTEQELPLGLYWKGKRTTVDRTVLPFQNLEVIETVNESRATRMREKTGSGMAFNFEASAVELSDWRNKLIWGDNKYVMAALLEQFAGTIDLIYIDPPFATGANFSTTVSKMTSLFRRRSFYQASPTRLSGKVNSTASSTKFSRSSKHT